jgi:hypothetical protein
MIQFANPAMLWALALLIAPILLHLRRKLAEPPVVPFSATHLLDQAAAQSARRSRLRQLLLLVVRVLLLAAIVLAFARPYRAPLSLIPHPSSFHGVRVVADNHEYLDAALPQTESGPDTLVFLSENPSLPEAKLGAKLTGIETGVVTVTAAPYFHPALAIFDEPTHGDLRRMRARRWWKLEPTGKTIVIARFSNGDPFLIEHWTERGRVITCALPADTTWSDLPRHANFVPLVNELVKYLSASPRSTHHASTPAARDLREVLLACSLVLALAELWLGGFHAWKLAPLALLVLLFVHPTFSWRSSGARPTSVAVVVDKTDSMRFRPAPPPGLPRAGVELTGSRTALGDALLALTNRAPAAAILASDGQHNSGISPAWAAAMLGVPVFTVAVGDAPPPRDVSIARLDTSDLVFSGETAIANATIVAHGYEQRAFALSLRQDNRTLLTTNVSPGDISLHFQAERTGIYTLRIELLPGEATVENNAREFAVTVVPQKIRVVLKHEKPDWEFRHVRHALERDPAVELVADATRADLVIATTNETWRLEGQSDEVFRRYWNDSVRRDFMGTHKMVRLSQPSQSEEMYALWRNDELLREVARVSGGEFFTEETIGELSATIQTFAPRERRQFDLRDSWLVLLVIAAGFISSWALRRAS